jgi:hypothetical protein
MKKHYSGYWATKEGKILNPSLREVGSFNKHLKRVLICLWDKEKKKNQRMYRSIMVWEAYNGLKPKGFDVDHINGDKTDDRLENLRLVTHSQNLKAYARRINKSTKYRGVSIDREWIRVTWVDANGKLRSKMRGFKTPEEAARFRDRKAFQAGYPIEGLNFPEEFIGRERPPPE